MLTQLEKPKIPSRLRNSGGSSEELLKRLGLGPMNAGVFCGEWIGGGPVIESVSPIDGKVLARVASGASEDYQCTMHHARAAFEIWQTIPAPKRGEIIR